MTVDEAKEIIRRFVLASKELEETLAGEPCDRVENAKILHTAAQQMSEDPAEDEYVQKCALSFMRGVIGGRRGLTPGQVVDREMDLHKKEEERGE